MLDGHKLVLRLSLRKDAKDEPAKAAAKAPGKGTKLVVRNVAFEATRKDIVALFGPFGQVKSCRLPKKFDGSHRCVCLAVALRCTDSKTCLCMAHGCPAKPAECAGACKHACLPSFLVTVCVLTIYF